MTRKFRRITWRNSLPVMAVLLASAILWTGDPIGLFSRRWREMITMVAGSFIAGSTSEGGGAVAFPIFTKVLHIQPWDSRNFTLGIQTFGMGAASLAIILKRIRVDWEVLLVSTLTGMIGMFAGCLFIHVPQPQTRVLFTGIQAALGIFLLYLWGNGFKIIGAGHHDPLMKMILPFFGLMGGLVSSAIGTGADVFVFAVCVILCRVSPRRITPTTIILQWALSVFGFILHLTMVHDVSTATLDQLHACIPVVLTFGPLGVLAARRWLTERRLSILILGLISAEVISTLILVPLHDSGGIALGSVGISLIVCVSGAARSHYQSTRNHDAISRFNLGSGFERETHAVPPT